MAYAKKCDRCGTIESSKIDSFKKTKEIQIHSCEIGHFPGPQETIHLCDYCYTEFINKWMKI